MADYRSKSNAFRYEFLWTSISSADEGNKNEEVDVLSWWKGFCGHMNLSKIARIILTTTVSSAATERSFSTFSNIHSKKRNRLSTPKAGKVILLGYGYVVTLLNTP